MKKLLVSVSIALALLFAVNISMMVKAADSKTGRNGSGGEGVTGRGGPVVQINEMYSGQMNYGQQKNLAGVDEKQMMKDLDDLKKMQQELMKKVMEFKNKYGIMPVLDMVEEWVVAFVHHAPRDKEI